MRDDRTEMPIFGKKEASSLGKQDERDLLEWIEGNNTAEQLEPAESVNVNIRSERLTIRLSREEVDALDHQCQALGIGRSTLVRMLVRQALGLIASKNASARDAI